jgi:hypothetical protein
MNRLKLLWLGELPLAEAFWQWAVSVGLVVNTIATAGFLALIVADHVVPALIVHALPLPYNIVAAVGVWRSADRFRGDRRLADLARIAAVAVFVVLTLV